MKGKTNNMTQNTKIRRPMGLLQFVGMALMVLALLGSCELETSRNSSCLF